MSTWIQAKIWGDYKGNDIELCRTASRIAGEQAVEYLMRERIPFTNNSRRIPFFKRDKYHGASEVYVITTSPDCYGEARRALEQMDRANRSGLVVSNY